MIWCSFTSLLSCTQLLYSMALIHAWVRHAGVLKRDMTRWKVFSLITCTRLSHSNCCLSVVKTHVGGHGFSREGTCGAIMTLYEPGSDSKNAIETLRPAESNVGLMSVTCLTSLIKYWNTLMCKITTLKSHCNYLELTLSLNYFALLKGSLLLHRVLWFRTVLYIMLFAVGSNNL